jgi:hypothetical protein
VKSQWMFHFASAVAGPVLAMSPLLLVAQVKGSVEISRMFSQAKADAGSAEDDVEVLEAFTASELPSQTYAAHLDVMREHVNDLEKLIRQLDGLRPEGSPSQQEAIDRINPMLRNLADQLTFTIKRLKDNKNQVHMESYRDYAHANYDLASRTADLISDFVEYGKAKARFESLENKLKVPPTGASE